MTGVTVTQVFLIAMVLIFAVPYLIWRLGRKEYYAPLVVVQIICGILLGPGILGTAFPDYYSFVFRPEVITALNGIAWWAVMIFVWIAGIELDISEAWKRRRETGVTAGLALVMPLLFGSVAAVILLRTGGGWIGEQGQYWQGCNRHRNGLRGYRTSNSHIVYGKVGDPTPAHRTAYFALMPAWMMWRYGVFWR